MRDLEPLLKEEADGVDVLLPCHEAQYVARWVAQVDLHHLCFAIHTPRLSAYHLGPSTSPLFPSLLENQRRVFCGVQIFTRLTPQDLGLWGEAWGMRVAAQGRTCLTVAST
jgi:hypothetical protein